MLSVLFSDVAAATNGEPSAVKGRLFSLPCTRRQRGRNMSTFIVVLVTICGALLTSASCPAEYVCKWEAGVYVLHCNPIVANYMFENVTSNINKANIPANATRLKIKCFSQLIVVQLHFSGLTNVSELTLDTFTVTSLSRQVFREVPRITRLTLRNLCWRHLEKSTFAGLNKLRALSVERLDDLEYIHPEVLVPLESLESLSFRYVGANNDRLMYADYAEILGRLPPSSRLRSLIMYAVHSENHPETYLNIDILFDRGRSSQNLRYLDLGHNNIVSIDGRPAQAWPVLEYICLAENVFLGAQAITSFWMQFCTHKTLKTIDLSRINERALSSGDAVFRLIVDEKCTLGVPMRLGPRVESVSVRDTTFIANSNTSHFPLCFNDYHNTMHYVDLSNGRLTKPLTFSLINLRALQYLNIQNLNTRRLTVTTFHGKPNLTMLLLGRNDMGASIANDSVNSLFARNIKLRMLDLAECHITAVPPDEFSQLHQLQILNLSHNEMTTFTVKLGKLTSLRLLNISHNRLTTLHATTLEELDYMASQRTVQVDISGNPLQCFSKHTEFIAWAKKTSVQFVNTKNTLCTSENGSQHISFGTESTEIIQREKVDNTWKYGIGISLAMVVLAVFIATLVWYRCRWKCAFYFHQIKKTPSADTNSRRTYKRDAFICYNSNDSTWVCHDLLQRLEDNRISTVIHHRDFLPGSILEETIRESIDMSRFTVLVLSPDFLSSNWCLLEMHLARNRIISEGRDVIVPIILREFPTSQLTRTLEGILSKSYIEWTDDPEGQALFWDKLITKLKQGGNIRPLQN
ncbi:hypothetical protein LSAT2_029482 [Lamellibrachia satsuma]|nr:hypothetical protein LSAT2_029482 [Lamellibrachia satsuma]